MKKLIEHAHLEPDDADAILAVAMLAALERENKRARRLAKQQRERKIRQSLRRARRAEV